MQNKPSLLQPRARLARQASEASGIDEAMIERLVRSFYGRARQDPLLGPVFEARVTDWEEHLARITDFWSSALLMSGRYRGQPLQAHKPLPIAAEHFDRWLALFEETARALCPPAAAAHFIAKARLIAESLELGVAGSHGVILGKGERFTGPRAKPEGEG